MPVEDCKERIRLKESYFVPHRKHRVLPLEKPNDKLRIGKYGTHLHTTTLCGQMQVFWCTL